MSPKEARRLVGHAETVAVALPMMVEDQPDTAERKRRDVQAIPFALPPAPGDRTVTEDDVRRIVREEPAKLSLQPIDYRGHSPRMACACGPGQCARANTTAGPCAHMRIAP